MNKSCALTALGGEGDEKWRKVVILGVFFLPARLIVQIVTSFFLFVMFVYLCSVMFIYLTLLSIFWWGRRKHKHPVPVSRVCCYLFHYFKSRSSFPSLVVLWAFVYQSSMLLDTFQWGGLKHKHPVLVCGLLVAISLFQSPNHKFSPVNLTWGVVRWV